MFDDVRLHSQGRTFIFPVGFGGGKAPSQPSPKGRSPIPTRLPVVGWLIILSLNGKISTASNAYG